MSVDLSQPFRTAIIGSSDITDYMDAYAGSFPVFTKVPVPDDAPNFLVVVHAQIGDGEDDGLSDQRPSIIRDITVYGPNAREPVNDRYRDVEATAFLIQQLFHRKKTSITVPGWSVVDVLAGGPFPAPTDDEQTVGRRVPVTARLARMD